MSSSKPYKLDQVGIRMVKEPPLYSAEPVNSPQAAVRLMSERLKGYDREVLAVVNLRNDLKPIGRGSRSLRIRHSRNQQDRKRICVFRKAGPYKQRQRKPWGGSDKDRSKTKWGRNRSYRSVRIRKHKEECHYRKNR